MKVPKHLTGLVVDHLRMMQRMTPISVREAGKIVSALSLVNNEVLKKDSWMTGHLEVFVTLVIAKAVRPEFFPKLLEGTLEEAELLDYFGATISTITEKKGGDRNPEYDHRTFWTFMLWKYILSDGQIEGTDAQLLGSIARLFDSFGEPDEIREIPKQINRDWLDLFEFHSN